MAREPLVECMYGWGRVFRLYDDYLEIHNRLYDLSDLMCVQPIYRRMLGVSSARLELQFRESLVVVRGIADVLLAQKVVTYLTRRTEITIAMAVEKVSKVPQALISPPYGPRGQVNFPFVLSCSPSQDFWEYYTPAYSDTYEADLFSSTIDADSTTSTYVQSEVIPDQFTPGPLPGDASRVPVGLEAVSALRWPDERQEQRLRRLKLLQVKREIRMYGFDVERLARRLRTEPLPIVSVPLRLRVNEIAHYSTEASLCSGSFDDTRYTRQRYNDQGYLILTNERIIYLGRRRQISLEYSYHWQASHLPGALSIFSNVGNKCQYFAMSRPLECMMYMDRIRHINAEARSVATISAPSQAIPVFFNEEADCTFMAWPGQ